MSSALAAYLLGIMVAWYPLSTHDFTHKSTDYTNARYASIAQDLATVALDPSEVPLLEDSENKPKGTGRIETAMLMLSWAGYESGGFAEDVDLMIKMGDGGRAKCLMQLHKPYMDNVVDRVTCFREGLRAMHDSMRMCRKGSLASRLAGYTVGHCVPEENGAKHRVNRAVKYLRENPFLFLDE
jgi:hypothetical protein